MLPLFWRLFGFRFALEGVSAAGVEGNCDQQHHALDDLLIIGVDIHEVETGRKRGQEDDAKDGAEHIALAAAHGCAAEAAGCDRVHAVGCADIGLRRAQAEGDHETCHAGHAAVQDVDDHFHPLDIDAGQTRAFNVAADGVDYSILVCCFQIYKIACCSAIAIFSIPFSCYFINISAQFKSEYVSNNSYIFAVCSRLSPMFVTPALHT